MLKGKSMEVKCYIAIFVFAALSTVLGYMIFHRNGRNAAKIAAPSNLAAAPAATGATAATPLLATI